MLHGHMLGMLAGLLATSTLRKLQQCYAYPAHAHIVTQMKSYACLKHCWVPGAATDQELDGSHELYIQRYQTMIINYIITRCSVADSQIIKKVFAMSELVCTKSTFH